MHESQWLAERFEADRTHLRSVAYRMLGSLSEADDAVQEAWLRLSRSGVGEVENLGGWMTTVVARVCLDMLRSRRSRREVAFGDDAPEPVAAGQAAIDPEQEAVLGDSVGLALLVVLEKLTPAERVAFVLHDMFGVPFEELAPVVGRSADATRQLASRARRRVRGATVGSEAELARQRAIVDAFRAASREGDLDRLLALLDPEAVIRADATAVGLGSAPETRGAPAVAAFFKGRARGAVPAVVGGAPGLVWAPGGRPRVAFVFTLAGDRIAGIDLVADPDHLEDLAVEILDG
ncbi:MAG TPA: sigma-70 family RNA polymerase sigma factor [Candidatus Dormibacteraeota bacterium]|nr:sigma-70 family RNA polymerase sigma factor [Candidatus Dormibacteraeota bacterium]